MKKIIETASSGASKSTLKNVKEFDLHEGKLAVKNYHESLQATAKDFLDRQANIADDKIDLIAQEVSLSSFDQYKEARWPSVIMRESKELDGSTPRDHLILAMCPLGISGLILSMVSLNNKEMPTELAFIISSIALGVAGGLWFLWVLFVTFSEAKFAYKTGYRQSVLDNIAFQSLQVAAFSKKFVFVSQRTNEGDSIGFKRYAFDDIKKVVSSDIEGETVFQAFKPDGSPIFTLKSGLAPDGVELQVELENRIQEARNDRYVYRTEHKKNQDGAWVKNVEAL